LRVIVFGAGAVGSLFGAHLAKGNDVTLICRRAHAEAINRKGLAVTGMSDFTVRPRASETAAGLEPPDIIFLSVKAYDTAEAAGQIRGIMAKGTVLVSLQNGLGNLEILREAFPRNRVLACITSHAAILRGPGVVEHTGRSYTAVGGSEGSGMVAELLARAGIESRVSQDIGAEIWLKAIVNSAINPVASLLRERNKVVLRKELLPLIEAIVSEGVQAAKSRGVSLSREAAMASVVAVATDTAENRCSMLTDIESGRRTEIMQISGAIARYGAEAGMRTPVNSLMTVLISSLGPEA